MAPTFAPALVWCEYVSELSVRGQPFTFLRDQPAYSVSAELRSAMVAHGGGEHIKIEYLNNHSCVRIRSIEPQPVRVFTR